MKSLILLLSTVISVFAEFAKNDKPYKRIENSQSVCIPLESNLLSCGPVISSELLDWFGLQAMNV
jgi:hypothetical protein